ncbi:MAG: 16S rRNA (guanine(527)-N(7))-methyltransferase RsmG [Actinobacteria bacterium]|nr:16S rRNA (guanine(527)-N(7))-methyltransferase RsmG [Actinomycetota bacterium]
MKHTDPVELPAWLDPFDEQLRAYASVLSTAGVEMGLIGPREVPRLWSRHLLNCAVVVGPGEPFVGLGSTVSDVGSGAGLPGLVWAITRPDLSIILVEPLLRRATFLQSVVADLGLADRVIIRRGRAEDCCADPDWHGVDVVTARAVAPLERLLGWTIPLLRVGGRLVALKGSGAQDEVDAAQGVAAALNVVDLEVQQCGAGVVEPVTTVVTGVRGTAQ